MSADVRTVPPSGWGPERSDAHRALFPHLTPEALRLFWLRSRGYTGPIDQDGTPVDLDDQDDAPTVIGVPGRHPGAATYRGGVLLPDGTVLRVGPDRGNSGTPLRPTGRTRHMPGGNGLPGRLPVLTGYKGGPIPTETFGTVRVSVNWRAIVALAAGWVSAMLAAFGEATGRQAFKWGGLAVMAALAVSLPILAVPKGFRPRPVPPKRRARGHVRRRVVAAVTGVGVVAFLVLAATVFVRVLDVATGVTR